MGDWNEWEDMKDTIVNDHKFLDSQPSNTKALTNIGDPGNKYVYTKLVDGVKRRIIMYSSNYVGGWATDAITNTPYNIRIGSQEEKRLFSVRFTSRVFAGRENDIITLYYDSPYLYEKHHYVSLNPTIIDKWQSTCNSLGPIVNRAALAGSIDANKTD